MKKAKEATSRGPEKLLAWRKKKGFTRTEAAVYLNFSFSTLRALEGGLRIPSLPRAVEIEKATRIKPKDWV